MLGNTTKFSIYTLYMYGLEMTCYGNFTMRAHCPATYERNEFDDKRHQSIFLEKLSRENIAPENDYGGRCTT